MKKSLLFAISASVLTVAAAVAVCSNNSLFTAKRRDASIYSLSFSSTNNRLVGEGASSLSGSINAKTGEDNNVGITYDKVSGLADAWISLEAGGSFYNTVEVLNMTSLNIVCSADLTISFGWANVDAGVVQPSSFTSYDFEDIALKNGTYSFEGYKPSLIKITNASSEAVGITSLTLNYECGTSADSGVKPDLFKIEDFHRNADATVLNPNYIWYGGKKLHRNFIIDGQFRINEYATNGHVAFQLAKNNRILLWDNASTKNSFFVTGQSNGTHFDGWGPKYSFPAGSTMTYRLLVTGDDAYFYIGDTLYLVMTNFGASAENGGVEFASQSVDIDYMNMTALTLADNETEYNAELAKMNAEVSLYGAKTYTDIIWPTLVSKGNPADASFVVGKSVGGQFVVPSYKGDYLSRNFALTGKLTLTEMGNNGHVHFCFNADMGKRFLVWKVNDTSVNIGTFGYSRTSVSYPYSAGVAYYFRVVNVGTISYFYFGTSVETLALRAVGSGIAAPSQHRQFELSSEKFAATMSEMTAITQAQDSAEWTTLMNDMSSTMSTYTSTTVVNS